MSVCSLVLVSCGGGSGGGLDSVTPGWVTIDASSAASTVCNDSTLTGTAFISPTWWGCCGGTAEHLTGVTVTWHNETGGQSGTAYQHVNLIGSFGISALADHTWSATVPLAMGTNTIAITAQDPSGITATKRTTVVKIGTSYSVSGRLANQADLGLGYFESGMSVLLSGPTTKTMVASSGANAGAFQGSCVPPGTYRLTPTPSAFNYIFAPPHIDFDVVNTDISGLNMIGAAFQVSGNITFSVNGNQSPSTLVSINSSVASLLATSDANGHFNFVVPNGNYRIQPSEFLCSQCVFTPAYQDIIVSGGDVTNVNFTR